MSRRNSKGVQIATHRPVRLGLWALSVILWWGYPGPRAALSFSVQAPVPLGAKDTQRRWNNLRTARWAALQDTLENPVRTVAETVAEFYRVYPKPPVLPMYRTFIIDLLTQLHLIVVDTRFKYDAIFALGIKENYARLMGSYDKLVGGPQSDNIWKAMLQATGMKEEAIETDAAAVKAYASSTKPADILKQMEGAVEATDARVGEAFKSIGSKLYSQTFSIGLFKIMELSGVEVSRANVEEWAKALKVTPSKATNDLETYKINQSKLRKSEEMIREVEIREKKKLAERLEAKAKAIAAKAAEKTAAAKPATDEAPEKKADA